MKNVTLALIVGTTLLFTLQHIRRPRVDFDNLSPHLHAVNDQTFRETLLESGSWVLLDFWAPWCGPCVRMKPEISDVAERTAGTLRVLSVNVDEARETADRFGIRGIPALVLLQEGQEVDRWTGFANRNVLQHWLDGRMRDS